MSASCSKQSLFENRGLSLPPSSFYGLPRVPRALGVPWRWFCSKHHWDFQSSLKFQDRIHFQLSLGSESGILCIRTGISAVRAREWEKTMEFLKRLIRYEIVCADVNTDQFHMLMIRPATSVGLTLFGVPRVPGRETGTACLPLGT